MAVAAFVRWASSGVHRSRPQRTTRPASNTGEPAVSDSTVSFSFLRHIAASAREGDSGVSCEGGAAIAGARCTSFAEDQIHIMGFATLFDRSAFRVLAATGRRCRTRPAATPVIEGRRDAERLDFEALSSKTACAVARDGCERGLAVHSVSR